MNVVSRQRLVEFWERHPQAQAPLTAWFRLARAAEWKNTQDVRSQFNTADFVADNRIIFDIGGNKYRLVVRVSYAYKQVLIKFVGTHKEYDAIDPATI
ncbi:MAG: type II toxin-antitoxin system HigB family toxin [Caulobacteraceae bacterium]